MNPSLIKTLSSELNLSDQELQIYLILNKNPRTTITQLSKQINISRVTTYKYLSNLQNLHLIQKYNNKIFLPQSPKQILDLLKAKQNKNIEIQNSFSLILPELLGQYYSAGGKQTVRYFEGLSQYKLILNELLLTKHEILLLGNDREFAEIIGWENYYDWIEKRTQKNIPFREVIFPFPEYSLHKDKNNEQLRKVKFLPSNLQQPGSVLINDKLISFWNPIFPKVIVIEDNVLNIFLKSVFEILWNSQYSTKKTTTK